MTNPNLVLAQGAAAAAEFDNYLKEPDKRYLLILGNGPAHSGLIQEALSQAWNWRWVITAPDPTPLLPRLLSLPLCPGVSKISDPWPGNILALSITSNKRIAYIITENQNSEIDFAFLLAETN